jgi:sialate O-acetylesterase
MGSLFRALFGDDSDVRVVRRGAPVHAIVTALLALTPAARADVTPAALFTDGAVLQREKPVAIWGRADRGEKITVSFAGQRRETTAGNDGRWLVMLEPLATSVQGAELVIAGKNTVTVRDVLVGEVWLCSGQSNMEWAVNRAANGVQEAAAANFPLIRHLKIERAVADTAADTVPTTGWKPATPGYTGAFTAVGYFFARDLFQKLGVPIGLVNSTWGGTPVESWLSPAALAGDPAFAVVRDRWRQSVAAYPAAKVAFDQQMSMWTAAEAEARKKGPAALEAFRRSSPRLRAPRGPGDPWTPSGLFNGMISPLLPYGLRGVLWYQGESNAERAEEYAPLFARLITSWREHFGQGDVPFYWVNLANFNPVEDPTGLTYARLREAQTRTLALPNTGQALALDIGDPLDIHPLNKQEVGRRLALLARNRVYGLVADDTGPTLAKVVREGATLRVHFANAANGLIAYEQAPQALQLAGADRVFHPAVGRIERDTLMVSSPAVKEPMAVRYAWHNIPAANLYNGAGLPAVPFRTDDW